MHTSSPWYRKAPVALAWIGLLLAAPARASFLSGEALDTAADWIAIIVLIVVPLVVIVVFWLVHVLPERLAEQRHHPQTAAIQTLCLLSLVFGGLLWPLAWIWAFTKPVAYRVAYGTDKSEEWHLEMGEKAKAGTLLEGELAHLRAELDSMAARGALPANLRQLRADLLQLAATHATTTAAGPGTAAPPPGGTPPTAGGRA
jgi:CBS domain containing-hemolysin-like protein